MNCTEIFSQRNFSRLILNQAFNDDSGSWWWWINVLGTLVFGLLGLIGNLICFFVVCRSHLSSHSFVEYLRALSLLDFLTLFYEVIQTANDLCNYLFSWNLLHFRSTFLCKLFEYSKYSIILLSCWMIVTLTVDRCILVCDPWRKTCPQLSRRLCNSTCARRVILILICSSLFLNSPHFIFKEWFCRPAGYQYSAVYNHQHLSNNETTTRVTKQMCSCRISPLLGASRKRFFIFWHNYIFHLLCYTILPAIILIASNAAILKRLHTPRQIISNQNEHLRSRLTATLTFVSLMFLSLYFPHAIVHTLSYVVLQNSPSHCNVRLILTLLICKRLSELLNIAALGINFFFYILAVRHYRSSAIQMLGLHHYQMFSRYLTIEHRNLRQPIPIPTVNITDSSNIRLLNVNQEHQPLSSTSLQHNRSSNTLRDSSLE